LLSQDHQATTEEFRKMFEAPTLAIPHQSQCQASCKRENLIIYKYMNTGNLIHYPTDAQLNIPRRMLKFTLKLTLKCSYIFWYEKTIIRERRVCASLKL
jgi:hypothetical protein